MLLNVPDQIDCALLLSGYTPFHDEGTPRLWLQGLYKFLALSGVEPEGVKMREDEGLYVLQVGQALVTILKANSPWHKARCQVALETHYDRETYSAMEKAVQEHSCHVYLSVGSRLPHTGDSPDENTPELAGVVEGKIQLCCIIADALARVFSPQAIHWCQSEQLVSAETVRAAAKATEFPLPLHMNSFFKQSGSDLNGRPLTRMLTYGAQYVIGREIAFKACVADGDWMYRRALDLVRKIRADNYTLPPDGYLLGPSSDELLQVRQFTIQSVGILELTVIKSRDFGIYPET